MRRKGRWIAVSLVVVSGIFLGAVLLLREKKESDLEDATAQAVRVGMPVSAADLVRNPPLAPEENAAVEFRELALLYEKESDHYGALYEEITGENIDFNLQVERNRVSELVQGYGPLIDLIERAAEKSGAKSTAFLK